MQKGRAIAPGKAHHQPFMNIWCVVVGDFIVVESHRVGAEGRGRLMMRQRGACKRWNLGLSFGCKVGSVVGKESEKRYVCKGSEGWKVSQRQVGKQSYSVEGKGKFMC